MKVFLLCSVVLGFMGLALAGPPMARLDSYKVYKIRVENEAQLKEFQKLGENLEAHYLKEVTSVGRSFDVAVAPFDQAKFEERLRHWQFIYEVTIQDLQEKIESLRKKVNGVLNPGLEWTSYHELDDIYDWLDHQVIKHPFTVRPYVIGYSYEGRPIKAIKISRRPGNKAIFIDANIHAIEHITSAAGTCFFEKLLNSGDPVMEELTLNYDWIFVPIVNPDGFHYTKNVHPLWRKNRKPTGFSNSSGICYGVDMNRNFNYHFKEAGYNIDVPCDHWYAGAKADSEPEVVALEKFILSFGDKIRVYMALHSYGNLLLLPYGHTNTTYPPNYKQMQTIAKGFADGAKVKHGTNFLYGQSGSLLNVVSGATKDWCYGVAGIPFSTTVELRDRGEYGFFLPPNQIIPVCEELTDGIIGLVKAATAEGLFNKK